ncbi:MAG: Rpn family recombination-promoting nuclease/putative transposase [Clostridium sp.]|nr:Rpn family recombination-promoting nuclease/putative transposase [Clostridium sp.]MCM1399076.1 Rpn family recombination-promoting nuclease/putative transposase [Clostridium sp.]MCM1459467.1 Rpn family recombination-promoting nuclease/putative transposase [Bacteroides sp.]
MNKKETRTVKSFEKLELKDDFMFGVIMRNPKYCKPFLETILGISISDIEYPRTQETINITADAKSVRLDVYVEDDKNTVYNIEMQVSINKNLPKRSRYYQGMIDLNVLEKGGDYKELKRSFVIFVCTFDLFGKGRHIYTFENRCLQDYEISLGDETTKIILNTKGTMDDITPEMKRLLNYIDGQAASDDFTMKLETAVKSVKNNEKWRIDYMTLEMHYREKYEEGVEDGLEQGIDIGRSEGRKQGISETITTTIALLRENGLSDSKITEVLINKYNLSPEEAEKYINMT